MCRLLQIGLHTRLSVDRYKVWMTGISRISQHEMIQSISDAIIWLLCLAMLPARVSPISQYEEPRMIIFINHFFYCYFCIYSPFLLYGVILYFILLYFCLISYYYCQLRMSFFCCRLIYYFLNRFSLYLASLVPAH